MKDLYEFLVTAELQQYFDNFKNRLKVSTIDQIKYVDDDDLAGIGMSKPEIRRLRQFFKKECPLSTLDKLRKINPLSAKSEKATSDRSSTDMSWFGSHTSKDSDTSSLHSLSTSSLLRKGKVGRSESARLSLRPVKKLNSALIGRPENDLRHVSHVGFDGAIFGDVEQYGDLSAQLPLKSANGRYSKVDMTSSCISLPVSSDFVTDLQYSRDDCCTGLSSSSSKYSDDEFSDFQMPDLSIGFDFGSSLMDEVMQALGMASVGNNDDSADTSNKKPPVIAKMPDIIGCAADGNDEDSDTATETGSDSDTETETETSSTSPQQSTLLQPSGPTTPTSQDGITGLGQRLPNANIRSPRGIPGFNYGNSGISGRLSTHESVVSDKLADNDGGDVNPLRRLRQNPLMFTR